MNALNSRPLEISSRRRNAWVKAVLDTTHLTVPLPLVMGDCEYFSIPSTPAYGFGYVLENEQRHDIKVVWGEFSQSVQSSPYVCRYHWIGHDKGTSCCAGRKCEIAPLNCGSCCYIRRIIDKFNDRCSDMRIGLIIPLEFKIVDINIATTTGSFGRWTEAQCQRAWVLIKSMSTNLGKKGITWSIVLLTITERNETNSNNKFETTHLGNSLYRGKM